MKPLDQKLLRDLQRLLPQVLAIALLSAMGVAVAVMSFAGLKALTVAEDRFYGATRFADVFATVTRAPRSVVRQLQAIDGVTAVDARAMTGGRHPLVSVIMNCRNSAAYLAEAIDYERRLMQDRNDLIFGQLEEALTISVEPLDKMFRQAGLSTDNLLNAVKQGYNGQGGPLTPLAFSTKGEPLDPDSLRANQILEGLDRLNLYRIAAQKTPFALPVKNSFRYTSGFGPRWGRMHNGTDFAAATGTPIYSTADGVVIHADWQSGYGRLIKIKHEFGIETRYAHLSKIRVKVGQRVSRGEHIGDMGNSGRSTGTHLHYEVRVGGKPVNPMIYIKAARDVF